MNEVVLKVEMTCEGSTTLIEMTFSAGMRGSRLCECRFARLEQEAGC